MGNKRVIKKVYFEVKASKEWQEKNGLEYVDKPENITCYTDNINKVMTIIIDVEKMIRPVEGKVENKD